MTMNPTDRPASVPTAVAVAVRRAAALPEDLALAEIRNLPVSEISASELADRWGWSRGRVRRRIKRWGKAGQLSGQIPGQKKVRLPAIRAATTPASNPATGRPATPA